MIVNYDNFELTASAAEKFLAIARRNTEQNTESLTRYSTNAFYRRRLGREFATRSVSHSFYGSFADARAGVASNRDENG